MSNPVETHWASLMRAAKHGDEAAYRRLLTELAPAVRATIRGRATRYGLSAADVEDAVQETLLAIHLKRETWREDQPIRPWIFAIAGYKIVDQLRRRYRHAEVDISDFTEILPAQAEPDPTVSTDMDRILARLSGRAGEIVRAIGMEGASVSDASRRFGMTEGAVRVALHRGLRKLADLRAGMVS